MPRQERKEILKNLEEQVGGPILAFVTGDRPNLEAQIARFQVTLFPRHLRSLGEHETLGLLLYTRGGETDAVWPIVGLLREHCSTLIALVPSYAHSAGTLMALGANKILMSRFATLSPIDPTTANAFNPQDPANPQNRIPIAVEDMLAFFEFAKSYTASDSTPGAAEAVPANAVAFQRLSDQVHPLALGNVQRSIHQIRQLAEKMIALHSKQRTKDEIDALVHNLTTAPRSHSHLIGRKEAQEIGVHVEEPSDEIEGLLVDYLVQLEADLELRDAFQPAALLGPPPQPPAGGAPPPAPPAPVTFTAERAYIETMTTLDVYLTEGTISRQPAAAPPMLMPGMPAPGQPVPTVEIIFDAWKEIE
jgi:hypothetical protein